MRRLVSRGDADTEDDLSHAERSHGQRPLLLLTHHQARGRYARCFEALRGRPQRRPAGLVFPDRQSLRPRNDSLPAVWHGPSRVRQRSDPAHKLSAHHQRCPELVGHGPGVRDQCQHPPTNRLAGRAEVVRGESQGESGTTEHHRAGSQKVRLPARQHVVAEVLHDKPGTGAAGAASVPAVKEMHMKTTAIKSLALALLCATVTASAQEKQPPRPAPRPTPAGERDFGQEKQKCPCEIAGTWKAQISKTEARFYEFDGAGDFAGAL